MPKGHVIASRITAENPDEVRRKILFIIFFLQKHDTAHNFVIILVLYKQGK